MNILFTSSEPSESQWGGSAESVRLWADAVAGRGHRVRIVWPDEPPATRFPSEWRFMWQAMSAAARYATRFGAMDIYHAQDRRAIIPTWIAARVKGRPCVLTLRDVGLLCPIATCLLSHPRVPSDCGQRRLWRTCAAEFRQWYGDSTALRAKLAARYAWLALERRIALRYDAVTFVSHGLMRVYEEAGFRPTTRRVTYSIAPIGVDVENRSGGRSVFIGKPSIGKGYLDYEEAAYLAGGVGDWRHIGPVPAVKGRCVRHMGPLPHEWTMREIAEADVVVVPSRQHDALPRVGLEALACGRAIVGTTVGGIPELVDRGKNGALVPPSRASWLAARILEILDNADLRESYENHSRRLAETRFSASSCSSDLERLYGALR